MNAADEIRKRFHLAIDEISRNFIKAYGLKFTREVGTLSSPLLRWLDFRYRYIDPKPRQVIVSDRFPKAGLPVKAERGLIRFVDLVRAGNDINTYQSKGLRSGNDTSNENRATRTDLLWADWNIHHFHLSDAPLQKDQKFSKRSSHQLFCIVGADLIALIDVLPHAQDDGYANLDLIETVRRNWPEYLEGFKINGLMPGEPLTAKEITAYRQNGLNSSLTFDNGVYMCPGMGITSASTPLRLTIGMDRISQFLDGLTQIVLDPEGLFQTTMIERGIKTPSFTLAITPRGLSVYEERSEIAFLLPRASSDAERTFLTDLHDFLSPDWAVNYLQTRNRRTK